MCTARCVRRRRASYQVNTPMSKTRDTLDILFDDEISFDRACAEVAALQLHGNPAAQSVVDAIMYALRPGTEALSRANVQQYLAMVDEGQLREMCKLLRNRNPRIARSWTDDQVKFLVRAWSAAHAR
jgi:hypothetical protein